MQGAARNLFIPLALAVGFAMIASYVLSSTLVPVLVVWLLPKTRVTRRGTDAFRSLPRQLPSLRRPDRWRRWLVVPGLSAVAAFVIVRLGGNLGREIFPSVDAGQFAAPAAGAAGTRIEETEKLANKALDIIAREVGAGNVEITLGFVGVQNAAYPINTIYLWTSGPEEAVMQVQLNRKAGIPVAELQERSAQSCCRRNCPTSASASSQTTSSARS